MRTLCDVCESAAAIIFCAADEAALCRSCDEKVSSLLFNLSTIQDFVYLLALFVMHLLFAINILVGLIW